PAPLHVRAGVNVAPLQLAFTHTVPDAHLRQAPAPSHMPSAPHVDCAACAHSLSGSVLLLTGRHRPSACVVLTLTHAWQVPAHALSQHTPSVQKPEMHSAPAAQAAPTALVDTQL